MKFNFNAIKLFFLNFLIPIISLAVTGALFIFVVYPSLIKLPIIAKEVESKVKLKDQLDIKLKNLNKILDFKSVVDEDSSLVSQAVSSTTDAPQLLTQIDMIAKDSGLKVQRLSYSFGEGVPSVDEKGQERTGDVVIVNLGAQGTYVQVVNFAKKFVNSTAVTDDPVNLDISKEDFVNMINKIKSLKYYNILIENISQQAQNASEV